MNFKKIGTKMLAIIIPIMIVAQGILTVVSAVTSEKIINEQMTDTMEAELGEQINTVNTYLESVQAMAEAIAYCVGGTYDQTDIDSYESLLGDLIQTNDIVLGSGLWFEPYAYDPDQKYMGPYYYKDGDSIVTTWDYSNAEYDYFVQEYYTNAVNATGPVITDPYYDETSDTIMSSCSSPIFDKNGDFIGCVTVDIELTAIKEIIDNVVVGEEGSAMLLSGSGVYLAGAEDSKIQSAMCITDDSNESMAEAGADIIANDEGEGTFTGDDGTDYNYYYDTLEGEDWKFIVYVPSSELTEPVMSLTATLLIICVVALVVAAVLIIMMIGGITKTITRVKEFTNELAQGYFNIEEVHVKGRDELADMSHSLNDMYGSNKDIIQHISVSASEMQEDSATLKETSETLKTGFDNISDGMVRVNEAMMNASAATEEVNASAEEVSENVEVLAKEAENSSSHAQEIRKRAQEVDKKSRESFEHARSLTEEYKGKLGESIEKAEVVQNISQMANVISDIADQITLLSLNASIEAARAGEQGKGFAVVAGEIGKLANETGEAVGSIQATIEDVQKSFQELSDNSSSLITFLEDTVTPDYDSFVKVAEQYGEDADSITELSEKISQMSEGISETVEQLTEAMKNIADSTQNTADISANIMDNIDDISNVVEQVSQMAGSQQDMSTELNSVISRFQL